ncbi:cystatin-B-like [Salminus brasiliensis]|uniref:cystatin-B-like n=1 Tax=Salminus brasiliensis TaxID=930266 RepID=UPI003B8394D6
MSSSQTGYWSDWKDADAEVKEICSKIKPVVEKKMGHDFPVFDALNYQQQIVKGRNYNIKVYAGNNQCVIILVWQKLDGELELTTARKVPLPE